MDPQDMTIPEIIAATRQAMAETIALLREAADLIDPDSKKEAA